MASGNVTINVKFNKQLMQLIADLLSELNELTDYIPEWNALEASKICENISLILGKMLDWKK